MPFFLNISRWLAQHFCGDKSLMPLVVQNSHVVVTIIDKMHHNFRIRNAFLWLWFHIPLDRIITMFGMSSADWKVIVKLRKRSKELERWKELSAMTDSLFWCVLWKCNLFRWDVIDWRFRFLRDLYGPQNRARPESKRNISVSGASQLGDISRVEPVEQWPTVGQFSSCVAVWCWKGRCWPRAIESHSVESSVKQKKAPHSHRPSKRSEDVNNETVHVRSYFWFVKISISEGRRGKPALSGGKKNAQKNKSHWVKMNLQHWGDVSTIIPANEAVGWDGCKITWTMLVWGSCFCLMDQIWEVFWEVSTPIAQLISFRVWNMPWRYEQAQMWHVYFFPRVGCRNFWIQHWCILVQPPSGCQSQQHLMTWNCVSAQWVTQTVRYFCARYVPEINIFLNSGCCFELSVAIASGA